MKASERQRDTHGRFVPPEDNIKASDEHGMSVTQTCRVTPTMARQISVLASESVATGKYPFKTKGDVLRWAIAEGLSHIEKAEDEERPYLPVHQIDTEMRNAREVRTDMERIYEEIQREVSALLLIGTEDARDDAEVMLQLNIERIFDLPDSPWRNRTLDSLKMKFPELLQKYRADRYLRFAAREKKDILPKKKTRKKKG